MMNIEVSFLTEKRTFCGVFKISFWESISHDNISDMVSLLQIDLNNNFRDTGKINSSDTLEKLQNIFGESAVVSLDRNLLFYGDDDIEDMLLNEIGGEHKVVLVFNNNVLRYVDVDEEGSGNKIEEIIQEGGITFY